MNNLTRFLVISFQSPVFVDLCRLSERARTLQFSVGRSRYGEIRCSFACLKCLFGFECSLSKRGLNRTLGPCATNLEMVL
jgi:hypothetical protein